MSDKQFVDGNKIRQVWKHYVEKLMKEENDGDNEISCEKNDLQTNCISIEDD